MLPRGSARTGAALAVAVGSRSAPARAATSPAARPPAATEAKPARGRALHVLCLHGFCQNAEVFRKKTGSLRRAMKGCEFWFAEAPHSAEGAFSDDNAEELGAGGGGGSGAGGAGPRGWWHAGENAQRAAGQERVRPAQSASCSGWQEGLESAGRDAEALAAEAGQGSFDGVLAFSQGCAVATALLRRAAAGGGGPLAGARFAVLVGGFVPRDAACAAQLRAGGGRAEPLAVHSLHVSGAADELVPRARSAALAELYCPASASWFELGATGDGRRWRRRAPRTARGPPIPTGTGAFKAALRGLLERAAGAG
ncbi:unnamed protein product [Prorocentrum cordatum]|uniref:Serine hydrolase domain-containing protein n=1 Tax=Prorocentrum cordatum TaxID=2364126 RepID=A0ABN9VSN5_9DINO|nr:unnamed protein product [Polarella glacialis]